MYFAYDEDLNLLLLNVIRCFIEVNFYSSFFLISNDMMISVPNTAEMQIAVTFPCDQFQPVKKLKVTIAKVKPQRSPVFQIYILFFNSVCRMCF